MQKWNYNAVPFTEAWKKKTMDDKLLDDVGDGGGSRCGGSKAEKPGKGSEVGGSGDGGDWPWTATWKRLRLQRHPSIGTVDEERSTIKSSDTGRRLLIYLFITNIVRRQLHFGVMEGNKLGKPNRASVDDVQVA